MPLRRPNEPKLPERDIWNHNALIRHQAHAFAPSERQVVATINHQYLWANGARKNIRKVNTFDSRRQRLTATLRKLMAYLKPLPTGRHFHSIHHKGALPAGAGSIFCTHVILVADKAISVDASPQPPLQQKSLRVAVNCLVNTHKPARILAPIGRLNFYISS